MTDSVSRPLRHRTNAGYVRGEETRRRIVEAALRLFGERGYDGASTRDIAAAAGVNAPALQYYFDNKAGVYRACAEHVADGWVEQFKPVLAQAQATMSDVTADLDQVFQAFGRLLSALADYLLLSDGAEHRRLFALHEQVGQGPIVLFEILDRDLRPRIGEMAAKLVARYCGVDSSDEVLRMRITMLFGQVMVFSVSGRSMAFKPIWKQVGAVELVMIKQTALEQCRMLMEHWRLNAQMV